jgi:hypothetical protein
MGGFLNDIKYATECLAEVFLAEDLFPVKLNLLLGFTPNIST